MAKIIPKTFKEAYHQISQKHLKVQDIVDSCYTQIKNKSHLNAFISVRDQKDLEQEINEAQQRYDQGKQLSNIDGIPIAIKDNLLVKGMECTAASKILQGIRQISLKFQGFTPPVNATVINRLKQKGAIIVGKTNMDEYGMGSIGMYGYDEKKIVRNPIDEGYIAGGSSSGSAVAVKSNQAFASLGTDTGGSVSYPAHCCGVYSLKPSYGRLSRYGQILYSSSNDTIGPIANSADDLLSLFEVMQGEDVNDSNCIDFNNEKVMRRDNDNSPSQTLNFKDITVGIISEFDIEELDERNRSLQQKLYDQMKDQGVKIVHLSMPLIKYALPLYFTLIPSEAASNLSRYDGLKYGYQKDVMQTDVQKQKQDLFDYIERVRSEAFGLNVKRRVLLGNFLLSSRFEDYNEKVIEAQQVRRILIEQYVQAFKEHNLDFIISPTAIGTEPPKIEDILNDAKSAQKNPVYEYKMDYYTALPNVTGTPAVTIPYMEKDQSFKFPTSYKIQGFFGEDFRLLQIAKLFQDNLNQ